MNRKIALSLILFSIILLVGCRTPGPSPDLQPSGDLKTFIDRSVHAWLNARVGEEDWERLRGSAIEWRNTSSPTELSDFFTMVMPAAAGDAEEMDYWRFSKLVTRIELSELYTTRPPPVDEFLKLLKGAISTFKYEE